MATSTPTNKQTDDNWLGEQGEKLPSTLNVLTILTIIWNVIAALLALLGFFRAQANYDNLVQNQDKIPDFMKGMMGPHPLESARLALDNRAPILLISLIGCALCFLGALQMRKLKKVGFSIYILGDIVPFATIIFVGTGNFSGFSAIIGLGIVLLFIILYATQLKAMK